jgi:serine/threonine/tyrosine protein kinase RAD53
LEKAVLTRILREGNKIAFGTFHPNHTIMVLKITVSTSQNTPPAPFLLIPPISGFVYRHTAAGPPEQGLYAHYDISTELGKGSFATVMKAISRTSGKWYAVKMIHKDRLNRPTTDGNGNVSRTASLSREISILEQLKHPNICQLKEVFYQDGDISTSLLLFD